MAAAPPPDGRSKDNAQIRAAYGQSLVSDIPGVRDANGEPVAPPQGGYWHMQGGLLQAEATEQSKVGPPLPAGSTVNAGHLAHAADYYKELARNCGDLGILHSDQKATTEAWRSALTKLKLNKNDQDKILNALDKGSVEGRARLLKALGKLKNESDELQLVTSLAGISNTNDLVHLLTALGKVRLAEGLPDVLAGFSQISVADQNELFPALAQLGKEELSRLLMTTAKLKGHKDFIGDLLYFSKIKLLRAFSRLSDSDQEKIVIALVKVQANIATRIAKGGKNEFIDALGKLDEKSQLALLTAVSSLKIDDENLVNFLTALAGTPLDLEKLLLAFAKRKDELYNLFTAPAKLSVDEQTRLFTALATLGDDDRNKLLSIFAKLELDEQAYLFAALAKLSVKYKPTFLLSIVRKGDDERQKLLTDLIRWGDANKEKQINSLNDIGKREAERLCVQIIPIDDVHKDVEEMFNILSSKKEIGPSGKIDAFGISWIAERVSLTPLNSDERRIATQAFSQVANDFLQSKTYSNNAGVLRAIALMLTTKKEDADKLYAYLLVENNRKDFVKAAPGDARAALIEKIIGSK